MNDSENTLDRRKFLTNSATLLAGGAAFARTCSFLRQNPGRERSDFPCPYWQREPGLGPGLDCRTVENHRIRVEMTTPPAICGG